MKIKPLFIFLLIFTLVWNYSCTKDTKPPINSTNRVILSTLSVSSIGQTTARSGGEITSDGGDTISERGVCWATSTNPTVDQSRSIDGSGIGNYVSIIENLLPNTQYYVRAYIKNAQGTLYGNQVMFRTLAGVPNLETTQASSIGATSANIGGRNIVSSGSSVTAKGVCWSSTNQNPTISNAFIVSGSGTANFAVTVNNLNPNTTYYVRAFATNSAGTGYGNTIQFRTLNVQVPSLTTVTISSITQNSAISGGNVSNDGGAAVTQRGICWSTSSNPTIANFRSLNGAGIGSFTAQMTNLQPNTTYYVRSYATNAAGTGYGQQFSFRTLNAQLATITTNSATSITRSSANSGGTIFSDGGSAVIQRGICWSTSSNPTISNSRTVDGSGVGSFFSQMTGLQANRTYYVRAYAVNSVGTSYGNQVIFTTQSFQLPTVNTSSIFNIGRTSASGGGSVTDDGGYTVTERGICWSLNTNPTISNSRTVNGSGLGSFSSSMTSLLPGRVYYVRAYARNALGISYGSQFSFRTNN